jgi:anthranilate phosphoribosyltransferase
MREWIEPLLRGENLTTGGASEAMATMMSGEATPAQVAGFLVALRAKGERTEEIVGLARVMRDRAARVTTSRSPLVDTCGTGGDGSGIFNISTAAAFVAAGAGMNVAKHGNRSASSQCGSADVLEALGVRIDISPEAVGRCLDEIGIGFCFAQTHHASMRHVAGPRRELGVRTVFNVLGPLTNPAGTTRQVLGVFEPGLTELLARVLRDLGSEHVMVVASGDGLDKVSPRGRTRVTELRDDAVRTYEVSPADFGLPEGDPSELVGGKAEQNARMLKNVLDGAKGTTRDAVLMNAGCAIVVGGGATTLREGAALAAEAVDSGRAAAALEALIEASRRHAEAAA